MMTLSQIWTFAFIRTWTVRLAVFFAPFALLRAGGLLFTLSDALFVLAAVMLISSRGLARQPLGRMTNLYLLLFVLFSMSLVGSSLISGDPVRGVIVNGQYVFAMILIPFVLSVHDEDEVEALIGWYCAGLILSLIYPFYVYFYKPTPNMFVSGAGRFSGYAGAANGMAALIALTIPLVCYLWMARYWRGIVCFVGIAMLLYALVATSSFNGIIATSIAFFVFFILTLDLRRFAKIALGLAILVPLFFSYGIDHLPQKFQERVVSVFETGDIEQAGTFTSRLVLIREALDIVDDTVLVGVGADQFRNHSSFGAPVHNTYLLLWAEGGLVCLVAWVAMILVLTWVGGAAFAVPEWRIAAAANISLGVTFLAIAISKTHMYGRLWVVPFFLACALVVAQRRRVEADEDVGDAERFRHDSLVALRLNTDARSS